MAVDKSGKYKAPETRGFINWYPQDAKDIMGEYYFPEAEKLFANGEINKYDTPERWKAVGDAFKEWRAENPRVQLESDKSWGKSFKEFLLGKEGYLEKLPERKNVRQFEDELIQDLDQKKRIQNALEALNQGPSALENQIGQSYQRQIPGLENMINNPLQSLGYGGSLYPGAIGQPKQQSLQDVLGNLTRQGLEQYGEQAMPYVQQGIRSTYDALGNLGQNIKSRFRR